MQTSRTVLFLRVMKSSKEEIQSLFIVAIRLCKELLRIHSPNHIHANLSILRDRHLCDVIEMGANTAVAIILPYINV